MAFNPRYKEAKEGGGGEGGRRVLDRRAVEGFPQDRLELSFDLRLRTSSLTFTLRFRKVFKLYLYSPIAARRQKLCVLMTYADNLTNVGT